MPEPTVKYPKADEVTEALLSQRKLSTAHKNMGRAVYQSPATELQTIQDELSPANLVEFAKELDAAKGKRRAILLDELKNLQMYAKNYPAYEKSLMAQMPPNPGKWQQEPYQPGVPTPLPMPPSMLRSAPPPPMPVGMFQNGTPEAPVGAGMINGAMVPNRFPQRPPTPSPIYGVRG